MYNAEKYIGECLDSILNQTFQNFEVVVVDDCSTDNSVAVVKSYAEKFGGRLTFTSLEKNSGSGAVPRNRGLSFSRGEYIFFADADDLLTKTALEELYNLAKYFDADVVYCEKYYTADADGSNIKLSYWPTDKFVDKPTLESDNLEERLQGILRRRYWVTPWVKFTKRNLLIEHEIFFPRCKISEDDVWTYGLVFYAKRFLRVPNAIYICRQSVESVSRISKTPQQTINFWLNPLILGLKFADKFMNKPEFFKENPQYRYAVLEQFTVIMFNMILQESFKLPPHEIYLTIQNEFGDKLGDYDVLIPALCAVLNAQQKNSVMNHQRFNQFAAQAQARIAELENEIQRLKS